MKSHANVYLICAIVLHFQGLLQRGSMEDFLDDKDLRSSAESPIDGSSDDEVRFICIRFNSFVPNMFKLSKNFMPSCRVF